VSFKQEPLRNYRLVQISQVHIMLHSSLIGGSSDLVSVAEGQRRILSPEHSDSVERIQQALVLLGTDFPESGIDGKFGDETGIAVSAFKESRGLSPSDPVVGIGTTKRLDLEMAYLENSTDVLEEVVDEPRILASDPFFAGILDKFNPDRGIPERILQFFQLSDELCLPLGPVFDQIASTMGKLVEPKIEMDYCKLQAPCIGNDFFDQRNTSEDYTNFLRTNNPSVPEDKILSTGSSVRPDILRHRNDQPEWYEIKPLSPTGLRDWLAKAIILRINYGGVFPYNQGKIYTPSSEISFGPFITDVGENLELFIEPRRPVPGMLLYRICIRGEYVRYFNRVRLIAGILAIIAALAPELLEAAAIEGVLEALQSLATQFGVTIPILRKVDIPNT
jgi:hypothetical protein